MNTVDVVTIVVGVFFVVGIIVGVLAVIAVSLLRPERKNRGYGMNDEIGNTRPRWPGTD